MWHNLRHHSLMSSWASVLKGVVGGRLATLTDMASSMVASGAQEGAWSSYGGALTVEGGALTLI